MSITTRGWGGSGTISISGWGGGFGAVIRRAVKRFTLLVARTARIVLFIDPEKE